MLELINLLNPSNPWGILAARFFVSRESHESRERAASHEPLGRRPKGLKSSARSCRLRRVFSAGWHTQAIARVLREICEICVRHIHRTWFSRFARDLREKIYSYCQFVNRYIFVLAMVIYYPLRSVRLAHYTPYRVLRRTEHCAPLTRYGLPLRQPSKDLVTPP